MSSRCLWLQRGEGSQRWAADSATFKIGHHHEGHKLVVAVRCALGDDPDEHVALLDTGAEWSVIGGELAELARKFATPVGSAQRISTRMGLIDGELHELQVTLMADEGRDLNVDARVLLCPDWQGPVVLGYRGLLEHLRIALAPDIRGNDNRLYFARAG